MSITGRKSSIKWILKRSAEREERRNGLICHRCGKSIQAKRNGRIPKYCSKACRLSQFEHESKPLSKRRKDAEPETKNDYCFECGGRLLENRDGYRVCRECGLVEGVAYAYDLDQRASFSSRPDRTLDRGRRKAISSIRKEGLRKLWIKRSRFKAQVRCLNHRV